LGNGGVIAKGDVQWMNSGSGIHSPGNAQG